MEFIQQKYAIRVQAIFMDTQYKPNFHMHIILLYRSNISLDYEDDHVGEYTSPMSASIAEKVQ